MIGVSSLHILGSELVLEALRAEMVLHEIRDVGRQKSAQVALGGATLDVAYGAIERRMHGLQLRKRFIDRCVDPLTQRGRQLWEERLRAVDRRGIEGTIETLQDAVIE